MKAMVQSTTFDCFRVMLAFGKSTTLHSIIISFDNFDRIFCVDFDDRWPSNELNINPNNVIIILELGFDLSGLRCRNFLRVECGGI